MKTPSQTRRFRPACEALEERAMTTVSSAVLTAGTLRIEADDANDNLVIRRVVPELSGEIHKFGGLGLALTPQIRVTDNTATTNNVHSFPAADVQRIEVVLNGGDDRLVSTLSIPLHVFGGAGNDTLTTGAGADHLSGGGQHDLLEAGAGDDTLLGGIGSDTLRGGEGHDRLFGGVGFNTLRGQGGDDRLFSNNRSDIVDGGAGYDSLDLIAKTVNPTVGGERIFINVPQDQIQTDSWSCGPNSGSRLLRSHGIDVSYSQLRNEVQEESALATFHLGTKPSVLRHAIAQHRGLTSLETESSRERVIDLLRQGKPVIALVATKTQSILFGKIGFLHYVVLNGFDEASQTVNYVDTNGKAKTWTFSEFDYHWRWFDHFTGAGEGAQLLLEGMGLRKRTIIF